MSSISVIIPTFNNSSQLIRCVLSIYKKFNIRKSNYEIIIVDDCSKLEHYNIIRNFIIKHKYINLHLTRNLKNSCPGSSINVGAKKAKFLNLLFLDSDVILYKDISNIIINDLKKYDAVVGHYHYKPINNILSANYKAIYNYLFFVRKGTTTFETFNASCAAIKKKFFTKLNGFDKNIKWGDDYENEEFGRRIIKSGKNITLNPKLTVQHEFPKLIKMFKLYFTRAIPYVSIILKDKKLESTGPASYEMIFSIILSVITLINFIMYFIFIKKFYLYLSIISSFLFILNNLNFLLFSIKIKPLQTPIFLMINFMLGISLSIAFIIGLISYVFKKHS